MSTHSQKYTGTYININIHQYQVVNYMHIHSFVVNTVGLAGSYFYAPLYSPTVFPVLQR